jgi:hypothetical protein
MDLLAFIANRRLGFETLETRRSGDDDFREVAVWTVRDALVDAFNLGVEVGTSGGSPLKANPRRRRTTRRRNPVNSEASRILNSFYAGGMLTHSQFARFAEEAKAVRTSTEAAALTARIIKTAQRR